MCPQCQGIELTLVAIWTIEVLWVTSNHDKIRVNLSDQPFGGPPVSLTGRQCNRAGSAFLVTRVAVVVIRVRPTSLC
jgi:hypothetical protein